MVSDRFSPYDILISEDQTVFFWFFLNYFLWEICSGSFIHPDPVTLLGKCWGCCAVYKSRETSCCLILVFTFCPAWPSYYGFYSSTQNRKKLVRFIIKTLTCSNLFIYFFGRHILDIYISSSISDSGLVRNRSRCEKLMFSIEHERSDQTLSASPRTLTL